MKRCPRCQRVEPDDALTYCRVDGTQLVNDSETGADDNEAATRALPASQPQQVTHQAEARDTARTTLLTHEPPTVKAKRKGNLLVAALIISIFGAAFSYLYLTRTRNHSTRNSIAVLPFVNTSGDPNMEYLSDGISESLINSLSKLPDMRVMARSTSFSFRGKDLDPTAIGRQLGVDAVLTGKIVHVGDNLSVQADLVNVSDGSQLWGERYNRKVTDILAVEEEIARKIVDKLRIRLSNADQDRLKKHYTENIEAYRTYLRGRYEWNKRTADGLNKAISLFNEAIALDPTYSLAHAGAADAYSLLPQFANVPFEQALTRAKAESLKALELDDSLAEAHISLANVKHSLWEWEGVEEGYKRGLALNPNYATGHQWYSEYLLPAGRFEEAEKEIRLAQQLDPLSLVINVRVGMTSYLSRHHELAEKQLRNALPFNPDFVLTNLFLSGALYQQNKIEESIPFYVKGVFNGYEAEEQRNVENTLRSAYKTSGKKGLFETVKRLLERSTKRDYGYPVFMAQVLLELGDKDGAFIWLNRAADVKHPGVLNAGVDPGLDDLRADPRFQELIKRVGI